MSSSTLTPKQLEIIGKITYARKRVNDTPDPWDNPTAVGMQIAAALCRECADIMDEVAACLTGEGSEAFKEALTNV